MTNTATEERKHPEGNSDIQNMLADYEMDLGIEREDLDDDELDADEETNSRLV